MFYHRLQHLALGHLGAGIGHQLHDLIGLDQPAEAESFHEQEITGDKGTLGAVLAIGGLGSPAGIRSVVDVVMDQGSAVYKLEGGRQHDGPLEVGALHCPER